MTKSINLLWLFFAKIPFRTLWCLWFQNLTENIYTCFYHYFVGRRKVQILDQVKTRVSCNFSEALKVWINDFECVDTGIEDVDVSIPLIVVCPKTSRLKPDVELAINNLPRMFFFIYLSIIKNKIAIVMFETYKLTLKCTCISN